MTRLIRTEWLKLGTTRGPLAAIAGVLALTALVTPIAMGDAGQGAASKAADAREALAVGPGFLTALMLLLLGAVASAGEFHHRTVVSTYLITPLRGRVLVAKLIAHAILGAVVAAAGAAISFPVVLLMARSDHLQIASNGHLAAVAFAIVVGGALASALGVAAGSILRNQTSAIVALLVWSLLVEKLVGGFLPPMLPFGSLMAAFGLAGVHGPPIAGSLAIAAAWAVAAALVAARLVRRDVAT
jgi:ABC-2 type transport system permease protein